MSGHLVADMESISDRIESCSLYDEKPVPRPLSKYIQAFGEYALVHPPPPQPKAQTKAQSKAQPKAQPKAVTEPQRGRPKGSKGKAQVRFGYLLSFVIQHC